MYLKEHHWSAIFGGRHRDKFFASTHFSFNSTHLPRRWSESQTSENYQLPSENGSKKLVVMLPEE